MKLIVITSECFLENEFEVLNKLFQNGLEILHLRKPYSNETQYEELLQKIDEEYHSNIVLHEHFSLTEKYNLKGVHFNRRNPSFEGNKELALSRSCHSLEELGNVDKYEYVFLSPIFDSISKSGYKSGFTSEELKNTANDGIINQKIIALGGINEKNIRQLPRFHFGGAAVLGIIWNQPSEKEKINKFIELQKLLKKR